MLGKYRGYFSRNIPEINRKNCDRNLRKITKNAEEGLIEYSEESRKIPRKLGEKITKNIKDNLIDIL